MGGKTTPAPLVFELVESVLRIGAVSIELPKTQDLMVKIGHQHGIFVAGHLLAVLAIGLDEAE